mmetsp:Transcript_22157/g.56142  ORF Transcript_22157/g.56142 Transcript_22157/m.56142 type:complete len:93 (+) Transcript_22157:331-609(+)
MTPTSIPVFDAAKFEDAKYCFIFQMAGLACAANCCPMVNGMSTTVQADRDHAHAVCHTPTSSHCDKAGQVAGNHALDDWLAAHPALATFIYP